RIANQNVSTSLLSWMRVRIIHVRRRTNGYEKLLAVLGKIQRARPVPPAIWKIGHVLRPSTRLQIAIVIGEPNHLVGIADIDPLRIGSHRIERDAVRPFQSARKNR